MSIKILNGKLFLDGNAIKEQNFSSALRNLNLQLLKIENHGNNVEHLKYSILPIVIHKNYNSLMVNEEVKKYFYVLTKVKAKKKYVFLLDSGKKLKIINLGVFRFFFSENVFKTKFSPTVIYPLGQKLNFVTSVGIIYNNKSLDTKNNRIYLHKSSINGKDNINCFLWRNHFTSEEIDERKIDENVTNYLINKNIILSNSLLNLKIIFHYVFFKIRLPSIGKIQLFSLLFLNIVYDNSNNLYRWSYGIGIGGNSRTNSIALLVGQKKNIKESLCYDLSFQPLY